MNNEMQETEAVTHSEQKPLPARGWSALGRFPERVHRYIRGQCMPTLLQAHDLDGLELFRKSGDPFVEKSEHGIVLVCRLCTNEKSHPVRDRSRSYGFFFDHHIVRGVLDVCKSLREEHERPLPLTRRMPTSEDASSHPQHPSHRHPPKDRCLSSS